VLGPFSILCWGVGAFYELPWSFIVLLGMGILAGVCGLGANLALSYAIDCYKDLEPSSSTPEKTKSNKKPDLQIEANASVLTAIILVRNTMSFAIGYGINPWISSMGLRDCFITAAVIACAAYLSWYLFIRFGKKMRIDGKERYIRLISL
jgi:hypothetical protein